MTATWRTPVLPGQPLKARSLPKWGVRGRYRSPAASLQTSLGRLVLAQPHIDLCRSRLSAVQVKCVISATSFGYEPVRAGKSERRAKARAASAGRSEAMSCGYGSRRPRLKRVDPDPVKRAAKGEAAEGPIGAIAAGALSSRCARGGGRRNNPSSARRQGRLTEPKGHVS
jgi:hypothetical protein